MPGGSGKTKGERIMEVCRGGAIKDSGRTATGHLSDANSREMRRGQEGACSLGVLAVPETAHKRKVSSAARQEGGQRLGRVLRPSLG